MQKQIENDGNHIQHAMDTTSCTRHKATTGIPCWHVRKGAKGLEGYYAAICGSRIRKAGFVGKISPESIRSKSPKADIKDGSRRPFNKKTDARPSHRENSK